MHGTFTYIYHKNQPNVQRWYLSKLLYFTGRLVEFRYFKFEIRLGRRNHEIRSEVVLSYVYKQLKI